jgi:hypothetical protein
MAHADELVLQAREDLENAMKEMDDTQEVHAKEKDEVRG